MSNKEILERAISKAIDGGWDFDGLLAPMDPGRYEVIAPFDGDYLRVKTTDWSGEENFEGIESVIYSHNFARAVWGEEEAGTEDFYSPKHNELSGSSWPTMWEYCLREMVISDDPIKYLGEHLDD